MTAIALVICSGCALQTGMVKDSSVIAIVNNENIEVKEFKDYIQHVHESIPPERFDMAIREMKLENMLDELINERLMLQDAQALNLEKEADFKEKLNHYILIQSVLKLRKEEVYDKREVTDEDLSKKYSKDYKQVKIKQIITKDRKTAKEALKLLKKGVDFDKVVEKKSVWKPQKKEAGTAVYIIDLPEFIQQAIAKLTRGQRTDILETFSGFYILKLEEILVAPKERFEEAKKGLKKELLKQKEAELSEGYVAILKGKAHIDIDSKLFVLLNPRSIECKEKVVICRINGKEITACDFADEVKQKRPDLFPGVPATEEILKKEREEILDRLITYELVEQEALKRDYMKDPSFQKKIEEYKKQALIGYYQQNLIGPRAVVSEKELEVYYNTHKDQFRKDYEVWFDSIVFLQRSDAEAAMKELKQGAGFEFLASKESVDDPVPGENVWVSLRSLSSVVSKAILELKAGETSGIVEAERKFYILKLKGKRGGEINEFSETADTIRGVVEKEKLESCFKEYISGLKKAAKIRINKRELNKLSDQFIHPKASGQTLQPQKQDKPIHDAGVSIPTGKTTDK
ncbi:MAG: peptidyl-prolyl cis-trans isomerase [Pseudomonadota bacterium]